MFLFWWKEAGKIYYFDPCNFSINKNDHVIVETSRGIEYGIVAIEPREVEESKLVSSLKPVLRIADNMDKYIHEENKKKAKDAIEICKVKAQEHMKAKYEFEVGNLDAAFELWNI